MSITQLNLLSCGSISALHKDTGKREASMSIEHDKIIGSTAEESQQLSCALRPRVTWLGFQCNVLEAPQLSHGHTRCTMLHSLTIMLHFHSLKYEYKDV